MAAVIVWTIPAIIGVVSSAIGLAQSSVFMMGAIIGMENNDRGKKELPEELGKPWTVWMQAGLDGSSNTSNPDDPHLIGAAGPFPDIYLFNDVGHYLGTELAKNTFVKQNSANHVDVYPNNVQTDDSQDATIMILSARDHERDGMLIAEIGFGHQEDQIFHSGPYSINGYTFRSCGAPWYPSGIYRPLPNGTSKTVPGFWLGGKHGLGAVQIHGPSHTAGKTTINIEKFKPGRNATVADIRREFCEHPARLRFWREPLKPSEVRNAVFSNFSTVADKTLSIAKNTNESVRFPGSGRNAFVSMSESHRKTITIVEDDIGHSAVEVCQSPTSTGPDYVNVNEGMFCRLADRTLFPVCSHVSHLDGSAASECFDVDSTRIVSQKTIRTRYRRTGRKVAQGGPYESEWRTDGSGWALVPYKR